MQYIRAKEENAIDIAKLHKEGIPTGFISKQSQFFLIRLYKYLISNEIVYIAKKDNAIVGFIALSLNTSLLYKSFVRKNIFIILKLVLINIFSMEFMKKAIETLRAPKTSKIDYTSKQIPELLSIVVNKKYQYNGIGNKLLAIVEERLTTLNLVEYKVIVGEDLDANLFYIKNEFILYNTIEIHANSKSFIYLKNIKNRNEI